jgi:hypothetical protein
VALECDSDAEETCNGSGKIQEEGKKVDRRGLADDKIK